MAISLFVIGASKEAPKIRVLDKISCICYLVQFCKDKGKDVLAFLDSGSEVNTMTPAYAAHLGLKVRVTDVGTQTIDGSSLATYNMVIATFQVVNKLGRSRFFQKTFLLTDISIKVVLAMPFLIFSNANIQFAEKEPTCKTYTTKEAFPTTRQVKIIDQNEFTKAALDENVKAFVVHVSFLGSKMTIQPAREAQWALLLAEEVTMATKYLDFADVFSEKSANILPERTGANKNPIELEKGKQLPYGPIYSLGPVEFETLKTYIKTNLANGFIRASKSLASTLILFVRKPNGTFRLCVNYRGLNNLTIKNCYLLTLIGKSLNWLSQAKQFIQLDFTSA